MRLDNVLALPEEESRAYYYEVIERLSKYSVRKLLNIMTGYVRYACVPGYVKDYVEKHPVGYKYETTDGKFKSLSVRTYITSPDGDGKGCEIEMMVNAAGYGLSVSIDGGAMMGILDIDVEEIIGKLHCGANGTEKRHGKMLNTEEFIRRARKVHGDKYDYSKVVYMGSQQPVTIICPEHGEFTQKPMSHLAGHGCPKCPVHRNIGKDEFIRRAQEVHGDRYDYSKVDYKNCLTKVCIVCPEHGEFWQTPVYHLSGRGCPACCNKKRGRKPKAEKK